VPPAGASFRGNGGTNAYNIAVAGIQTVIVDELPTVASESFQIERRVATV
jgi:hypothetical protein